MKLIPGLGFNPTEPATKMADYIKIAETLGYEGISFLGDSQLIWRSVYVCLTLALLQTNRIRIGPGVTNPVTRDPSVTAGTIATLNELSPGRVVLGIGVGDSSVKTIHRSRANLNDLEEAIRSIRALVRGDEVDVAGRKIRLPWSKNRIPIYVGSAGSKSLKLAGKVADGVIINVGANSDLIGWAKRQLEEGVKEAGRSLKELDIWVRVTCSPDPDIVKAQEMIRSSAATKAHGLVKYLGDPSFRSNLSSELIEDIERLAKNYNYYDHQKRGASHADFVTRRIFENLVIAGPPSLCISRLEEIMKETGLHQFSFTTYGFPNIPEFLNILAEEIIHPLQ